MSNNRFKINFINGLTLEVKNSPNNEYYVEFIDQDTDKIYFQTTLKNNHWASPSPKYFLNWKILIKNLKGEVIYEYYIMLKIKEYLLTLKVVLLEIH